MLDAFRQFLLIILLATTMQGETEVLCSEEAAMAVYEVAMNRVDDPRFSDDLAVVLREGFTGWRRINATQVEYIYYALAFKSLAGGHRWGHKAKYMLSEEDVRILGFDKRKAVTSFCNDGWCVYLFERWGT